MLNKQQLTLISIVSLCTIFCQISEAQITGKVQDKNTKDPIVGATIIISKVHYEFSGFNGSYILQNIPYGTYTASCSFLGYKTIHQKIDIKTSPITLNFDLEEDEIVLSEVIITGIAMHFGGVPPNFGDYSIQLKADHKKSTEEVISELRTKIGQDFPVLHISFGQRIADLLGDLMSTPSPIEVKFFGENYDQLKQISIPATEILGHIKGVADIDNGLRIAAPTIVFLPKQDILNQYKISLLDFQNQLAAYTDGIPLGMNANQRSFV